MYLLVWFGSYGLFALVATVSFVATRDSSRSTRLIVSVVSAGVAVAAISLAILLMLEAAEPGERWSAGLIVIIAGLAAGGALLLAGIVVNLWLVRVAGWLAVVAALAMPSILVIALPVAGIAATVLWPHRRSRKRKPVQDPGRGRVGPVKQP